MKTISIILLLALPLAAKEGAVECGNLIYAGTRTSKCFSDEFLTTVQQKTSIATERRFKAVKLADDELFKIPFVIMTGEADFNLPAKERENLKKYLENGGFLLASASCSNEAWSKSFEREIKSHLRQRLPQGHPAGPRDLPHRLHHQGPEALPRRPAAHAQGPHPQRQNRRRLYRRRPQRQLPCRELLLLRRQRNPQLHGNQRQHPRLRAASLIDDCWHAGMPKR